jgi:uncharacterized repeat protein (TIGR02543 family)
MKRIVCFFILLFATFTLVSCKSGDSEDIFRYRTYNDKSNLSIYDFTEDGKLEEVVHFPTKLASYDRVTIGDPVGIFPTGEARQFRSDNLRIAIIGDVDMIASSAFMNYVPKLEKIVLMHDEVISIQADFAGHNSDNLLVEIIVPFEIFELYSTTYKDLMLVQLSSLKSSRVSFYEGESLYWISYDPNGEFIQKPNDPVKNGFQFLGWFIDEEGNQEFDFNDDASKTVYDLKLYAKWG